MAELHLANLRTWREQEYARRNFAGRELDRLAIALERIAGGAEDGGKIVNVARQIVAELPTGPGS
jgi:hypothetical protein